MDKAELKTFLVKSWMTHDAMWLKNAFLHTGPQMANKLNRAAVRDMAGIEVKRLSKVLDLNGVHSSSDMNSLLQGAKELLMGDFMDYSWEWPEPNKLRMTFNRCFAFDGMTAAGLIDHYQCGIFERLYGWFDALHVPFEVSPKVDSCMMHTNGHCYRDIVFKFKV